MAKGKIKPILLKAAIYTGIAAAVAGVAFLALTKSVPVEVVTVNARGEPLADTRVIINGEDIGKTNAAGRFTYKMRHLRFRTNKAELVNEANGYLFEPWMEEFKVGKLSVEDGRHPVHVELKLKAMYFWVVARDKTGGVVGAKISVGKDEVGSTDASGRFRVVYGGKEEQRLLVKVESEGKPLYKHREAIKPGKVVDINYDNLVPLTIYTKSREYGSALALADVQVYIDGKYDGKTDSAGRFFYPLFGSEGDKLMINMRRSGYLPRNWTKTITLDGRTEKVIIRRYFLPEKARPLKVALYRLVSNLPEGAPEVDLEMVREKLEDHLFARRFFKEVKAAKARGLFGTRKFSFDKITTQGWDGVYALKNNLDLIVTASLSQRENLILEVSIYGSAGGLIMSALEEGGSGDLGGMCKDVVRKVFANFPYEGVVTSARKNEAETNLGDGDGREVKRGGLLQVMRPNVDRWGSIDAKKPYRSSGVLKLGKVKDESSKGKLDKPSGNDRVREAYPVMSIVEDKFRYVSNATLDLQVVTSTVKGERVVAGVNVYLDQDWVGTTDAEGKLEVPMVLKKKRSILLYKHGFKDRHLDYTIKAKSSSEKIAMESYSCRLFVDSDPPGARLSVDEEEVGETPYDSGARTFTVGFHRLLISKGGDYRDFDEVVEFLGREMSLRGERRIALHKDFLRLGEAVEEEGDIDAAMALYAKVDETHPDFTDSRARLAMLHFDKKDDPDRAIVEYQKVLSLPENRELINKKVAVLYLNIGHVYYQKAEELLREKDAFLGGFKTAWRGMVDKMSGDGAVSNDPEELLKNAVKNLEVAAENKRFFPDEDFDNAVHDSYYYLALADQKLYEITKAKDYLIKADLAWKEYFDFYPLSFEGQPEYGELKANAEDHWNTVKYHLSGTE